MSSNLKKLVAELEKVLAERGDSLDAPAREAFQVQIDGLKRGIDEAKAAEISRLTLDALNVLAALLGVVTNVMTLLK
ncbi:hypothetical protein QZN29_19715 [Burkholderia multivorans]|nr:MULTISPECIES: hypothetical protein [Burkholderiaceae]MCS6513923.1 hypothetical protein [Burkholderia thailandensis]MDN8089943.1 hypothetical protein [Burkholderia multivorans]MDN8095808.1 hypothetical protein [Burkholderia multivorans]MDN8106790.1 hypothetical protein [Burkholderia multivorans]MDN8128714.1 hypothetical protein [Burkholderia multivorans]